jgi:hypothetical protein
MTLTPRLTKRGVSLPTYRAHARHTDMQPRGQFEFHARLEIPPQGSAVEEAIGIERDPDMSLD